jgi:MFS family permease
MTGEVSCHDKQEEVRKRIFSSLYGAVFTTMIGIGIVIPLLPGYAQDLGASGIYIGLIFSSFALSRALFMPFFGRLSDNRGRRALIITGLCGYVTLSVLYIFADSVSTLILIRFLHGITSAMIFPIALAYIGDISPLGMEGRYMGSFTSSMFLGMGIGPLLGGVVTDIYGIDATFLAMAGMSAIALLTCILLLPDRRGTSTRPAPMLSLILHPGLRGPILYQFINAFANGTFMVFLPVIAAYVGELSVAETGVIISVSILSTALLQKVLGKLADQYNKFYLIALGTIIVAVALALVPGFHGFYPYLIYAFLMGIGGGIAVPAMFALVTITGRETGQGSAMGVVNMVMSMGMIVSPLICGWIMDISNVSAVFNISAYIVAISTPLFIMMGVKSHKKKKPRLSDAGTRSIK